MPVLTLYVTGVGYTLQYYYFPDSKCGSTIIDEHRCAVQVFIKFRGLEWEAS